MHDDEPDTFILKSIPESLCDTLKDIGLTVTPKEVGTDDVEIGDYFGRLYVQAPRMITNKGCIEIKNSNIDVIQIIQKG